MADALQKLSRHDQILAREHMLQAVLVDRFKLTVHPETEETPVNFLVIAKSGAKLQEAKPGFILPDGSKVPDWASGVFFHTPKTRQANGKRILVSVAASMAELADFLTDLSDDPTDHPVVDNTALTGKYDFTVPFSEDASGPAEAPGGAPGGASPRSDLFSRRTATLKAIEKQLGLKLERGTGPVEFTVIDHVERPSGN